MDKNTLNKFLYEDHRVNYPFGVKAYMRGLIYNPESFVVMRYLKYLRYCEFYCENKSFVSKILYKYYAIRKQRLGTRYQISIPEGVTGYGLRIYHLSGGGYLAECQ